MKRQSGKLASLVIAAAALITTAAHAAVTYRITDLGPGTASSINNVGQVLGSTAGDSPRSYVFTPGSGMTLLPDGFIYPGGGASSINDFGFVAGTFIFPGMTQPHAALFQPGIGLRDLGALGGPASRATGVNNAGQVTGEASLPPDSGIDVAHAFRYGRDTGMVDLGTLGEQAASSFGNAINSAGQVTGGSWHFLLNDTSDIHAFVQSGSEAMLAIAGNQGPGAVSGAAINDAGQVTGTFQTRDFILPFLYTPATGAVLLSEPEWEFVSGSGHGLNAKGQVVGMVAHYAFLYSGNAFINLNTLLDPASAAGWSLDVARDINDSGQIVGYGLRNGVQHAFLLTPVPEPASWALMLGGLALLGAAMPRRRASSALGGTSVQEPPLRS